jgi:hypothetical protein
MQVIRNLVASGILCLVASGSLWGQWIGKQTGCYADSIAANPNRPTVADPADITQYGVLELEYGWDHLWAEDGGRQTSLGGLLKFGLLCDLELRWNTTSLLSMTDAGGSRRGFGDNWVGPQMRFYKQTRRVPSMAFGYAAKIPSASTDKGLGSGRVDHSITFLARKDMAGVHFDFNATRFVIGRENASGFDQNSEFNLAFSRPLHGKLLFTGELYGNTRLNPANPRFISSLWSLTYAISPRLILDSGFETGLSSGGPHRHLFVGFTYSIGNLYPGYRRRQLDHP